MTRTFWFKLLMAVGLLLCLAGSGWTADDSATSTDEADLIEQRVDAFIAERPVFLRDTRLTSLRKLAKFKRETVQYVDNPHIPGQKVEFRRLEFEGLVLSGPVVKGKLEPNRVEISSPQWPVPRGLSVGSPAKRIAQALGIPPLLIQQPVITLDGLVDSVEFCIKDGKIIKVAYSYYFD